LPKTGCRISARYFEYRERLVRRVPAADRDKLLVKVHGA
jgi:hypothetical protein